MSDSSNFGFGKFVPGFDFLQNLASNAVKGASNSIPQLPNMSHWVAPTLNVEDLEKRIEELKAVQFWLDQNAVALKATIQALEVQKMTLATLKGMNFSMGDVANALKLKTADTVMSGLHKAGDTVAGAASSVSGAMQRATAPAPAVEEEDSAATAKPTAKAKAKSGKADAVPGVVDPLQWWGSLTQQFQQIAAAAVKDAARQTAVSTTKNMASGLAKEMVKTATGMTKAAARKAVPAKKRAAPKKAAAKKSAAR